MASVGLPIITFSERLKSVFQRRRDSPLAHAGAGTPMAIAMVFFPAADVVHTGDVFSNHRFPYIDIEAGGNAVRLLEVADFCSAELKPGVKSSRGTAHSANLDDLRLYREMLARASDRSKRESKPAKTLAQLQKGRRRPQNGKGWEHAFVFAGALDQLVYQSVQSARKKRGRVTALPEKRGLVVFAGVRRFARARSPSSRKAEETSRDRRAARCRDGAHCAPI